MKKVISIVDRKEAIRTACMLAKKGDVILVAEVSDLCLISSTTF